MIRPSRCARQRRFLVVTASLLMPVAAQAEPAAERLVVVAPTPSSLSNVSLDALQPASTVGEAYLRDVVPPTAAYDDIVRITPGAVSVEPDGAGLSENASLTVRGFADGQYNVTFDGIPFADADDFSHHSTAYFAGQALREVSVDRGPGTASTIGDATFGGTIALRSIDPAAVAGLSVSATGGSFATARFGGRLDSEALAAGGRLVVDLEHAGSDGAVSGSGQTRTNLFAKLVQPVGAGTTLTFAAATEWLRQYQPPGATRAQIAAYGPSFGLGRDPASQNDRAYNGETYRTDFAYASLQSRLADGLRFDGTLYTYGLYRHFSNGEDVNGGTPNGTAFGAADIPGQRSRNGLRAFGTLLRLTRTWRDGSLRGGAWVEHQSNDRSRYEVDLTLDGLPNPVLPTVAGVPGSEAIDRLQHDTLDSLQPYLELEWRPLPSLTITQGIKYASFARTVAAPVMEDNRLMQHDHVRYGAALPALAANERLSPSWSAYAQAAKGFLAPQLQFLDVPDPGANRVKPEQTWNFQVGSNWRRPGLQLAIDAYYIDFENRVGSRTTGAETRFFNQGGADYLGLEGEAGLGLGHGVSVYGNFSLSRARDRRSGAPVPNAPDATLAAGLLYRGQGWTATLVDKWVGARYGDTGRTAGLAPFNQLDLSLGRGVVLPGRRLPRLKLLLTAQNLLDATRIDALAGYTLASATPLWFTQAGRSFLMTATASF